MNVLLARLSILSVCVFAIAATPAHAQSPTVTSVPRIVRVTSTFHPADGKPPAAVETMTLSIYAEETGGVPLWQETQTVSVNPDGRFTLLLGSTRPEGLPLDLFASGEPRWLAIHVERPGEGEPGRIRLLLLNSVTTSPAAANTADECWGPSELDQGRLQNSSVRGNQTGRHVQHRACPGSRSSGFSVSEVCRRIYGVHHRYERSEFVRRRCSSLDPISGNSIPEGGCRRCFSTTPMFLPTGMVFY